MLPSEAIQMLIDNIETTAGIAGKMVNEKMRQDFEDMAKGTVDSYYEYVNGVYTRYGRTYGLYNIYNVTSNMKQTKSKINFEVNLNLDPGKLEGRYSSNASQKYQPVDAGYVFNNFMASVHPWTNGWPTSGAPDLVYKEIKSGPKVHNTIVNYKKAYGDKYFRPYVDKIFMSLIKLYL